MRACVCVCNDQVRLAVKSFAQLGRRIISGCCALIFGINGGDFHRFIRIGLRNRGGTNWGEPKDSLGRFDCSPMLKQYTHLNNS